MAKQTVVMRLNQQQCDLLDRTVACDVDPERAARIRLAPREYGLTSDCVHDSFNLYVRTAADLAEIPPLTALPSQRTPADFRNATIKAARGLRRDPSCQPQIANVPVACQDFPVALDYSELAMLDHCRLTAQHDDGAALSNVVFSGWRERCIGNAS